MNNQEFVALVEDAINKFEKQNAFSRSNTGGCFYLSDNGNCCIVGHMMPNDEVRLSADEKVNESSIFALHRSGFPWAQQFNKGQIKLLADLQAIHDGGVGFSDAIDDMVCNLLGYRKLHNV